MSSLYTRQALLVIPAAAQTTANALAQSLTQKAADALTFTVPLSATGAAPASHYWCCAVVTEADWTTIRDVLTPRVPGGIYYCLDATTGVLLETNSPGAAGDVGSSWTPQQTLTDRGLRTLAPGGDSGF